MQNKKVILTIVMLAISLLNGYAQIGKGSMAIGSSLYGSYNSTKLNDDANRTNWAELVNPTFEYFFKNNLSVGFKMGYYINKTKIVSDAIAQTGRF